MTWGDARGGYLLNCASLGAWPCNGTHLSCALSTHIWADMCMLPSSTMTHSTPDPIVPSVHMSTASNTDYFAQPWRTGLHLVSFGQMRKVGSERSSELLKVTQQVTFLLSFTAFA